MGFCFPGYDAKKSDLPPRRECKATWHDRLFAAMPRARLIVVVGAYARAYHFERLGIAAPRGESLTETVARWRDFSCLQPRLFALPHSSWRNTGWLKSHPWFEAELLPELRAAVADALA